MRDVDQIMNAEYAEQELLRHAVEAADRIICEGYGGDNDKLLLLTAMIACAFMEKVRMMAQSTVTRKEILGNVRTTDCYIRKGAFGRWIIVRGIDTALAWSGFRWVPHKDGIATGDVQIANFERAEQAYSEARANGLTPVL